MLPGWLTVILWVATGAMGTLAILRFVAWDSLEMLVVINSVTLFVFVPAWPIVVVAGVGRRPWLAGAALLVVVAQLSFLAPEFAAAEPVPGWASAAPTIRVMDANVYEANSSMAGYEHQIQEFHPDLLTMEEASPADFLQLQHSGALHPLQFRYEVRRYNSRAFLIASAFPLTNQRVVTVLGAPSIVEVTVNLPSGPRDVWVVHSNAPAPGTFGLWRAQLMEITDLLRARGVRGLLMLGDFNASWGNQRFRAILDTGMTDGAAARGRALDMTWSQTMRPLPPLVRIDHVLTGPGVAVTRIVTGVGQGSDHRDLMATVAFGHAG